MSWRRSFRLGFVILVTVTLSLLMVGLLANAREEAKMYVVTRWNAGCSGGTRTLWDNMVDAWYDEITDQGFELGGWCLWGHCGKAYSKDGRQVDGRIRNSQFADASACSCGNDTTHLDAGDAVMVGWHGGNDNGVYEGSMRVDESGSGDCDLRRDEMELGDWDLEFLHMSSCHSMDRNMWSNWWRAFGGVHQIDGFHGCMWIGSSFINDYEDFADDAFSMSIADAWLDNMYRTNVNGQYDQCPVAYAVGASRNDVLTRIGSERYGHVSSDPTNIQWWAAMYIRGCNPACESALP